MHPFYRFAAGLSRRRRQGADSPGSLIYLSAFLADTCPLLAKSGPYALVPSTSATDPMGMVTDLAGFGFAWADMIMIIGNGGAGA